MKSNLFYKYRQFQDMHLTKGNQILVRSHYNAISLDRECGARRDKSSL